MSEGTVNPPVPPALPESPVPPAIPPAETAKLPDPSPSVSRYKRVIGRLTKIEFENYRAFRGRFSLDLPDGCNLLVYGENGAGKSSLFNGLTDFLESPERLTKHDAHRHRYNTDPSAIRLSFSAPSATDVLMPDKVYEWSAAKNDPRSPEMRTVDQGKGFLDYRSLLRVHQLPLGKNEINLFDVLINPLLALYQNPVTRKSFGEEWKDIQRPFQPYCWKPSWLDTSIKNFNAGFERVVRDSVSFASKLLSDFDPELAVDVEYKPASYRWKPKDLIPPTILLRPSFKRSRQDDYYQFLNEARLSALAMTIYFSGLKQSPAADFRLLVLDDILIGLDMSNRMMVLNIVQKLFRDWQVIILTYHKAWFEVLKSRMRDGEWSRDWKTVTLRMRKAAGVEIPIAVASSETLLIQARNHFAPEAPVPADIKAAAVYARTAFEAMMSSYCEEMRLPVTYVESRRDLDTNDFLRSIEKHLSTLRNPKDCALAAAILKEIKHARHFVLNPHSHFNPELEDEISAEISNGIRAVEDFDLLLSCLTRDDFAEPDEKLEQITIGEQIGSALAHLQAGRKAAAIDALKKAFTAHMDEWFTFREEMISYGQKQTTGGLLALSGKRKMFSDLTWLRLKNAKEYLTGKVHVEKFDPTVFNSAARLLLQLRIHLLAAKFSKSP